MKGHGPVFETSTDKVEFEKKIRAKTLREVLKKVSKLDQIESSLDDVVDLLKEMLAKK